MSYSSNVYPPNKGQMDTLLTKMDNIVTAINKQTEAHTWEQIQANVQAGLGATLYPVGHQFEITHSVYGTHKWDVVDHDNNPSATGKTHTMTLLMHDCLANIQFDAVEALIYASSAISAGAYSVSINSVTYYFTTTVAVPQGGQLVVSAGSAYVPTQFKSYSSASSTTVLETITVTTTAISGATSLGTAGSGDVNHMHRAWYGSNNYKESAMRQFLNSDSAAGNVWTPQTKFDRPPSWATNTAGFLAGLPTAFLNVLDTATVKCAANNTYESPDSSVTINTAYTVADKIFLASRVEVGFGAGDVTDGSTLWDYYDGATNADRIKLLSGSARYWWLRTPHSGHAYGVRNVHTDGSLDNRTASGSYGCVPACIIG